MLEIKNLTFGWDNNTLFENLCGEIKSSEIVRLSGENGVGKTTLLQLISGMIPHFIRGEILLGEIDIDGKSIIKYPPKEFFPAIAYIPRANINFFLLTDSLAHEILLASSRLFISPAVAEERFNEFCQFFPELESVKEASFAELSLNQKIVMITFIFFLQNAKLYLFDEALTGFSDLEIAKWYSFFDVLKVQGKSIILVDHHQQLKSHLPWLLSKKKILIS